MTADVGAPIAPGAARRPLREAFGLKFGGAAEYVVIPALALIGSLALDRKSVV